MRVTFDDLDGVRWQGELVEIVDFPESPEKYTRLGAPWQRTCYLSRPGTA